MANDFAKEDVLTFLDVFADGLKRAVAAYRGCAAPAAETALAAKPEKKAKKAKRVTVLQMACAILRKSAEPMKKPAILKAIKEIYKRDVTLAVLNTAFNNAIKGRKGIKRLERGLYTNIRRKDEGVEAQVEAPVVEAPAPVEAAPAPAPAPAPVEAPAEA